MNNQRHAILLTTLLLAVLGCTLVYAFGYRIQPDVDPRWYDTVAWNLATGKGFRLLETDSLASKAKRSRIPDKEPAGRICRQKA